MGPGGDREWDAASMTMHRTNSRSSPNAAASGSWMTEEEADYCRICRTGGTFEQPLFYPCKCSGSIKFVHQDCLMEWLSHSQKKYCELCKTPFTFTKLYDGSMPQTLPLPLFLRQLVLHIVRALLKWTRCILVLVVWLGWLPWSIRQVWRGLFWLADGSWVASNGYEVMASNGTSTSPLLLEDPPVTNVSIAPEIINTIPQAAATATGFTISTGDFLFTKLIKLLYPNVFRWAGALVTGVPLSGANPDSSSIERLPSFLSDVNYLKTFTKHPVVNNLVIDVLEGQLICLLVITAFILVFLIREWVINQQPAANVPDPDRAEEAAPPPQPNPEPGQVIRRRRRGLRDVIDLGDRGQDAGEPILPEVPQPIDLAELPRSDLPDHFAAHTVDLMESPDLDDQLNRDSSLPDLEETQEALQNSPGIEDNNEDGSLPFLEARPTLHVRNALDQAVDIRRNIEEGTVEIPYLIDRQPSSSGNFDEIDNSSAPVSTSPDDTEPFQGIIRIGLDPRERNEDFFQAGLAPASNTSSEGGSDVEADRSTAEFPQVQSQTMAPLSSSEESHRLDPAPSNVVYSSDSSLDAEAIPTPIDDTTDPDSPISEMDIDSVQATFASTTGQDQPSSQGGDDNDPLEVSLWDRIADWLWHTDGYIPAPEGNIPEDDEHLVQDVGREFPFVPAQARPQRDGAIAADGNVALDQRPDPMALAADDPFGLDLNNQDAIDDAEDLDGVLELIGMHGPITGMVQNVIFGEFLITLTLAASIWLPYIWGKIALLILAHPVGMFIQAPIHLLSSTANTIVDLVLFAAGLTLYAINLSLDQLIRAVASLSPELAKKIKTTFFKSLALTLTKGSGNRIEKELSRIAFGLRPDLPTFSVLSHQALHTFERDLIEIWNNTFRGLTIPFHKFPSNLEKWLSRPHILQSISRTELAPLLYTLRNKVLYVSNLIIRSLLSMKNYLEETPAIEIDSLDYNLARWSTRDKVITIILGYTFFACAGYLYLKINRLIFGLKSGDKVEGVIADSLLQAGGVVKVILIISIEMIVFPLYCGLLLDIALMPLFAGVTWEQRLSLLMQAPMTTIFVHWFIGTCYMFHFALFVSMCRKILRKGVLYFIRDPDDPTFHPVRDVLERPVAGQLSKIAFSALVYGGLVIFCCGGVIWALTFFDGLLPINWATDEPKLEVPIDVVFYNFLLPIFLRKLEPSKKIGTIWEWWFRGCARALRLTHFLFNEVKEDERGTYTLRAWWALSRKEQGDIHSTTAEQTQEVDTDFRRDGKFVRAPASDSVRIPKGDRVFLEVNEKNERVDGLEDKDEGPHGKNNKNFAQIYIPPNFRARIAIFIFLVWLFAAVSGVSLTIAPLIVGRKVIKYMAQSDKPPNDLYALTIGLHLTAGLMYAIAYNRAFMDWISLKALSVVKNIKEMLPNLKSAILYVLGLAYMFINFGIILPFIFSVLTEFYFLIPLYTYLASTSSSNSSTLATPEYPFSSTLHILQTWTVGLLYLRVAIRLAASYPTPQTRAATAIRAILRNGITNPDVRLATRAFILPSLVLFFTLLCAPLGLGWIINKSMHVAQSTPRTTIYRYSYPGLLAVALVGYSVLLIQRQITVWRIRIRDDMYLIGERLHNFGEGRRKGSVSTKGKQRAVSERLDVR